MTEHHHPAAATPSARLAPGTWDLHPAASRIAFRHRIVWGLVPVEGVFHEVSGAGEIRSDGSVTGLISIVAASLDTGNARRDGHLRSSDFLDTGAYPAITFAVHREDLPAPDGPAEVLGTLSVKGIGRPVPVAASVRRTAPDTVVLTGRATVTPASHRVRMPRALGFMRPTTEVEVDLTFVRDPVPG
ncbi:YceI family protein [Streptomyces sp. NPDC052023]|uniref:YceI family protein n=1 Tax=Streptomyces sp. NPDC052023 TaxID=3365681 RepID=UPI0037CE76E8